MRFKITALKPVESYIEAPTIEMAATAAQLECGADRVKLLSVEPAEQAHQPVSAVTAEFDWPALAELRRQDGHY